MCDEIINNQTNANSCFDINATLVIKQDAIVDNVKYIKESTGAKVIAVVKENGVREGDTVRVKVNPLFVHPYVERMVI